jgi:hypothetical protein
MRSNLEIRQNLLGVKEISGIELHESDPGDGVVHRRLQRAESDKNSGVDDCIFQYFSRGNWKILNICDISGIFFLRRFFWARKNSEKTNDKKSMKKI